MLVGDVLRLIRRYFSLIASNVSAGFFLYCWRLQGVDFVHEQSTISLIVGFLCIATAIYDWWREFRCPVTKAIANSRKIYKLHKYGVLDYVD